MARFDTRRTNQDCGASDRPTRSYPRSGAKWILVALLLCFVATAGAQIGAAARIVKGQPAPSPDAKTAPSSAPAAVATPAPPPPPPPDPLGRNTPHGTVLGFLKAAEAQDYTRAAEYLDGKRPPEKGVELAKQLKTLIDLGNIDISSIPRTPEGNLDEPLRVSRESVGIIKTPTGDLNVLLDRVELVNQAPVWRFSQETLTRVPTAYASMRHREISSYFPEWSTRIRFLAIPLWRWAGIFIAVGICLLSATLLTRLLVWLLRLLSRSRFTSTVFTSAVEHTVSKLRAPIFGLMLAIALEIANDYALTALGRHLWSVIATFVALISGAWIIVRVSDILASFLAHRLTLQMQVERATFIGLLARLFKILVGIILFLVLLTEAGVNVSALLAGLGIGGIALALAAQRTLADLFGGISIVMRGAVRVGDFCTIDGVQGTVEEVAISSLKLRTMDRSLVSIPNAKVAEGKLENFSMRDQFWLRQIFTLQVNTPNKVVKLVLDRIVQLLATEPDIYKESARARLIGLTPAGPQIEVFAYFRNPDGQWATFLGTQEKVILKIMSIVESEGASFVSPIAVVQTPKEKPEKPVDSAKPDV